MQDQRTPVHETGADQSLQRTQCGSVTCLFTRAGFRKRGVSKALADAAVEHTRTHGARAIEAYPITIKDVIAEDLHVGAPATFTAAGLVEVHRPTQRRWVMRLDFSN